MRTSNGDVVLLDMVLMLFEGMVTTTVVTICSKEERLSFDQVVALNQAALQPDPGSYDRFYQGHTFQNSGFSRGSKSTQLTSVSDSTYRKKEIVPVSLSRPLDRDKKTSISKSYYRIQDEMLNSYGQKIKGYYHATSINEKLNEKHKVLSYTLRPEMGGSAVWSTLDKALDTLKSMGKHPDIDKNITIRKYVITVS